ncbi:MAG: hypothetical protein LCH43_13925 [Actinobacteria bacterium]|nr:hypothetical protein [Actinomycetota bacterium]
MRILSLVALALLLTGCTPNTDAAYKNCYDTLSLTVKYDETLTFDEQVDKLVKVAELCQELARTNPDQFIEDWGELGGDSVGVPLVSSLPGHAKGITDRLP